MHIYTSHTQPHHPLAMPTIYQIMLGWKNALHLSFAYGNFEGLGKMKENDPQKYTNTQAFIVSQDNYMVSEW